MRAVPAQVARVVVVADEVPAPDVVDPTVAVVVDAVQTSPWFDQMFGAEIRVVVGDAGVGDRDHTLGLPVVTSHASGASMSTSETC